MRAGERHPKEDAAGGGCSEICVLKRQFSIKMENRLDESNRSLRETRDYCTM